MKRALNIQKIIAVAAITLTGVITALTTYQSRMAEGDVSPHQATSVNETAIDLSGSNLLSPLSTADTETKERVSSAYGRLPLQFEQNKGQTHADVRFISRGQGYSLFLTNTEAVLSLRKDALPQPPRIAPETDDKQPTTPDEMGAWQASERERFARESKAAGERTVLRMKIEGANPDAHVAGANETPSRTNYFIGNNRREWRTNIANYERVQYREVYKGVDLVYYGNQGQLQYDFTVRPGADARAITLNFEGAEKVWLDDKGELVLRLPDGGELRQRAPYTYQDVNGARREVASRFRLKDGNRVGFEVDNYDRNLPLTIDPLIVYSTYLGGRSGDTAFDVAVDSSGNAYVTGYTDSPDFPTLNPTQTRPTPDSNNRWAFVTKFNPAGNALVFSTYIGGTTGMACYDDFGDKGYGVALDAAGNVYVAGFTLTSNFPTTANAFQPVAAGCGDGFLTKLAPQGNQLLYSTFFGGSDGAGGTAADRIFDVAADAAGNAYLVGDTRSNNLPLKNAFQTARNRGYTGFSNGGHEDGFVAKINTNASGAASLLFSSYVGGAAADSGLGIATDGAGNLYATGWCIQASNAPPVTDFPVTTRIFGGFPQPNNARLPFGTNPQGAWVVKVNTNNQGRASLQYSTIIASGSLNYGTDIAVDAAGSAYVLGSGFGEYFPTTPGAFQAVNKGGDAFVTKLDATASTLVYSTRLGGTKSEASYDVSGIAVDAKGSAYVTGYTSSRDFPTTANAPQPNPGSVAGQTCIDSSGFSRDCTDAFVTKLNSRGTGLIYSTYLGGAGNETGYGIAVDHARNAYIVGSTQSKDDPATADRNENFPTTPGAYRTAPVGVDQNGNYSGDAFLTKIERECEPDQPNDLKVASISPSQVVLTWKDESDNETAFEIERKNAGGEFSKIATVAADSFLFTTESSCEGTPPQFRVRAINQRTQGTCVSPYSNEAAQAISPGPPVFKTKSSAVIGGGKPYRYDANAIDPRGEKIYYALLNNPQGMTINRETGAVEWTPAAALMGQIFDVTILATNGMCQGSVLQSYTLSIGEAPNTADGFFEIAVGQLRLKSESVFRVTSPGKIESLPANKRALDIESGTYKLGGAVKLNDYLFFTGDISVTVDRAAATLDIQIDSGELYLVEEAGKADSDRTTIWRGEKFSFHLDANGEMTRLLQQGVETPLRAAGVDIKINSAKLLLEDSSNLGIRIQGALNIPSVPGLPQLSGSFKDLIITQKNGIRFTGRIALTDFNLGVLQVKKLLLKFVAHPTDPTKDIFEGEGDLVTPAFQLIGKVKFIGGGLDSIFASLNFPGVGIPITPVTPILNITGGALEVEGLRSGKFSIFLGVNLTIAHPSLAKVISLTEVGIRYTFPNEIEGSGDLRIFQAEAARAFLGLKVPYSFKLGGEIKLIEDFPVFIVKGDLAAGYKEGAGGALVFFVEGGASGKIQIPDGRGFPFDLLKAQPINLRLPYTVATAEVAYRNNKFTYNSTLPIIGDTTLAVENVRGQIEGELRRRYDEAQAVLNDAKRRVDEERRKIEEARDRIIQGIEVAAAEAQIQAANAVIGQLQPQIKQAQDLIRSIEEQVTRIKATVGHNLPLLPKNISVGKPSDGTLRTRLSADENAGALRAMGRDRESMGDNPHEGHGLVIPARESVNTTDATDESNANAEANETYPPLAQAVGTVTVPASSPRLIVRLFSEAGAPTLALVSPTGTRITQANAAQNNATYVLPADTKDAYLVVQNPAAGAWAVETDSTSTVVLDAWGADIAPQMNTVAAATSGANINITYNAADANSADAKVSLFYDTDNAGFNGQLITEGLAQSATGAFTWTPANDKVPAGDYYVYAVLDDDLNQPARRYATTKLTITDPLAPPVPQSFTAVPGGENDIVVTWTANAGTNTKGYVVRYALNGADPETSPAQTKDVGLATSGRLTGLLPNASYNVTVSAYNMIQSANPLDPLVPRTEVRTSVPTVVRTVQTGAASPPVVRLNSPDGGERVTNNYSWTISWSVSNGNDLVDQQIELSTDGGSTWRPLAIRLSADVRNWTWDVPSELASTRARIRVSALDRAGNEGADASNANFAVGTSVPVFRIGGRIAQNADALPNVTVTLATTVAGATTTRTAVTDANGDYFFDNVIEGSNNTVTPQLAGYAFTPPAQTVNNISANNVAVNFSATRSAFTLAGRITTNNGVDGLSNVVVTLRPQAGGADRTATTDANGNYSFADTTAGSYTVTPALANYTFSPASQNINLDGNRADVNFAATLNTYNIAVRVADASNNPLSGVTLTLSGTRTATGTTDQNGNFTFENLPAGGNYLITPAKDGYTFALTSLSFSNLTRNETGGFVASLTTSVLQFGAASYAVAENDQTGELRLTVVRTGNTSQPVSVSYTTADNTTELFNCNPVNYPNGEFRGIATSRCDYSTVVGTLSFAAGETSKTISIPVSNDVHVEGAETFTVALRDAANAAIGQVGSATVTIQDDDATNQVANPYNDNRFFSRQQYLDFFGRNPSEQEISSWANVMMSNCGDFVDDPADGVCYDRTWIASMGFFQSIEFQQKGYYAYRFYKLLGRDRLPLYGEFKPNMVSLTDTTDATKNRFAGEFMQRADYLAAYPATLTNDGFVDKIVQMTGLASLNTAQMKADLNANAKTRAQLLREVVESQELFNREFNEAWVVMHYFAFLQRDGSASEYASWKAVFDRNPADWRTVSYGFVTSTEYKQRFGDPQR